ncbi:IPT/TIG domain-containing protein, partial [Kitasatospora nipponensis]|uniref:IPT/TIG domain-containing protein n=1 Tax=Kitasatospora nipponensis TaxID=258049 RepID=UPI0031D6A78A
MTAPIITTATPASGPAGTTVLLTGSGFTGVTSVRFGVVAASFTVVSATVISATAPAGSGTVQVTVTSPSGTSNGIAFTYAPAAPVITVSTPASGPAGATVTLTGSGFTGVTSVHFGAVAATFTVVSDTQVLTTAPAGSGTVQITVTSPSGTSNGIAFTYVPTAPAISSVSPASGPAGATVTLTGSGFTGVTSV